MPSVARALTYGLVMSDGLPLGLAVVRGVSVAATSAGMAASRSSGIVTLGLALSSGGDLTAGLTSSGGFMTSLGASTDNIFDSDTPGEIESLLLPVSISSSGNSTEAWLSL